MDTGINIEKKFKFSGELTKRKIREYFPAMIITNLSTLLLITVDGIVVGNMVGNDALASVNIFSPATVFIGVISALLASGVANRLSEGMGKIDLKGLLATRSTLKLLMVLLAVLVAFIQIPLVNAVVSSYHLSPEMNDLTMSYATGVMISMPFGLISNVGVFQLQAVGKMKVLMGLSTMEGIANLVLDLVLVGPVGMGVAGAGFGTAGANILRCTVTVIYLAKKTDMYYSGDVKPSLAEAKAILSLGLPEGANSLMLAVQNYAMVAIILSVIGETGGTIKGVWTFAASLGTVLINGVQGSMRPMSGLLSGAQDYKGLHLLMKQGIRMVVILVGLLTVFIEIFPPLIYMLHGVKDIPTDGEMALRLAVLSLVFTGVNTLYRLYFSNRGIVKFSTILTLVANATMPAFAFILSQVFPPVWIWLSYLLTSLVLFTANVIRFRKVKAEDKKTDGTGERDLYLTITPEEAIDASRQIRQYAADNGINSKHAFRIALCIEEMVAYAVDSHESQNVNLQIMIRFFPDSALLMIIDDGKCIFLDREPEKQQIVTNNYDLLRKISKSVDYQYVLNLNYTVCRY